MFYAYKRVGGTMKCERCGNEDLKYFYLDRDQYYCRKCIQFGRVNVEEKIIPKTYMCKKHRVKPKLDFELTDAQKEASRQILENSINKQDSLVYACCGAGKTEITYEVITYFLNHGYKVGFAISRRQVVLEIASRLKKAFPRLKVVPVCEGYTEVDDGDLIVCTMHQLYRYHQTFDLLIMDEVDAFPYKNNEVLESIAMNACKGIKIYLTATPTKKMMEDVNNQKIKLIELFVRPHGYPQVVPKIILLPNSLQIVHMLITIHKNHGQYLIFVPTIELANNYSFILSKFIKCTSFTSKTENKEEIIQKFRNHELRIIFCSTILERGVTFKNIHVLVLNSDHQVFDESSLIQIVGRVGRNPNYPTGICILYGEEKTYSMKRCKYAIKKMNETL